MDGTLCKPWKAANIAEVNCCSLYAVHNNTKVFDDIHCQTTNGQLFRQLGCKCCAHLSVLLPKERLASCPVIASM